MRNIRRQHRKAEGTSIYRALEHLDVWVAARVSAFPNLTAWQIRAKQIYGSLTDAEMCYIMAYKAMDKKLKLDYLDDMAAHMTAVREGIRKVWLLQRQQQNMHILNDRSVGQFLGMMQQISQEVGALMRSLTPAAVGATKP